MKKLANMNLKNKIATTFALAALVVGFLVADIFGQTRLEPQGEATLFGTHTTAAGQFMRLAVANRLPVSVREIIPCVRVRIVFDIYEQSKTDSLRLVFVRRLERTMTLDPGEAASLDFSESRTGGERVSVSVFVIPEEVTGDGSVRGTAVATLEVFQGGQAGDGSVRKISTLPGVIKGFDP
ncbi:MAG: hypothetical protein LC768_16410 [Acidobacteria bacterium]|nr:hypothetical protein [Acidobacteriota bacterium]MCA1639882.1 hypothetical protein [Acidobacteriota bacterium]